MEKDGFKTQDGGDGGGYQVPPPPYYTNNPIPQAPPVYMVDPPPNSVPVPQSSYPLPPGSFATHQYVTPGNAPAVVQFTNLRSRTTRMICPHCQADVSTRVSFRTGRFTHLAAIVLCLIACCPCALIPYCCDDAKDVEHFCPNCNKFIGTYRR